MPQTVISESNITIENQIYTGDLYARKMHKDGRPYHTFRTATVLVDGDHITFRNCTFENTAGRGEDVGQAIALYIDGDDIRLENCVLRGHQDTLFLAPLPPKEIEKDGFLGPRQFTARTPRTVYFRNCYIEGGVDFIFGGATAVFEDCEFRSNEVGYVFAPNTPQDVPQGMIARNCVFTANPDVPDASCYIARPWREYAAVSLEHCYLGRHIHPDGWGDWNGRGAGGTTRFSETGSYGPGAEGTRPGYVRSTGE
ncbi:pectinesterase [Lachnospiraceae bacterium NK3A20]|nr:pectinesterase [Lachnospiraceae bacterium NK3A20]